MKKVFYLMAMTGMLTIPAANAQVTRVVEVAEVPVSKHSVQTNGFWDNWFVSLNAGAQFSYLAPAGSQDFKDRITFSGLAYAGKWFTPGMGMRLAYNGYDFKGHHGKLNYMNLHVDALMNVTNMVMGYDSERFYNMIPYVGMGAVRVFDLNNYSFGFNAGLLNTFRINDSWKLNLEMGALLADKQMDGLTGPKRAFDDIFSLTAGVTYTIGGDTWNNSPDISSLLMMNAAEVAALNDALMQEQNTNRNLRNQLAQKPREVIKEKMVSADCAFVPQSIFFNLNSAKIASHKDMVNLKAVAETAKADNVKLRIVGYADKATGNAQYNQKLSLHRAQTIADELIKLGVNKSNITVEGQGGVDTLNPSTYNRRVIIQLN
jgi:outer membrane protein OmpA-like peptidoglycan-associated protein